MAFHTKHLVAALAFFTFAACSEGGMGNVDGKGHSTGGICGDTCGGPLVGTWLVSQYCGEVDPLCPTIQPTSYFTFRSNGTYKVALILDCPGQAESEDYLNIGEGSYAVEGDQLTLDPDGGTAPFTLGYCVRGNRLSTAAPESSLYATWTRQ